MNRVDSRGNPRDFSGTYSIAGAYPTPYVIFSQKTGRGICYGKDCPVSSNPIAAALAKTVNSLFQFFFMNFKLYGIDGKGKIADLYIDWDVKNAQWGCSAGEGNEQCSWTFHNSYALKPEVVGHEYFHSIVHYQAPLNDKSQPAALNESLADVFGKAFEHWLNDTKVSGNSDWNIGDVRNISDHITMDSFEKNGDAHFNSLIPSHAFAGAVTMTDKMSYGLISQIWFQAFLKVKPNETFKEFAYKTLSASFSFSGNLTPKITQAWMDIKVLKVEIPEPVLNKNVPKKYRVKH